MRFTWFAKSFVLLVALALLIPSTLLAQNIVTGGISGTVTDPSGAVVPNAKLTCKSTATGETLETNTTSTGLYNFPLLKPGTYTVSISQSGFRGVSQKLDVLLGQVTMANIKLAVGNTSETVEVTGAAPLLQTEDANITTTYTPTQIDTLPSPGGDITNYAQTAPGVIMNSGSGGYGNFSAFGLPATSNLFTLNGNDENDPFLNLNNSGSSNLLLGQNEVQEVAVVSNGYTGQYGRQAGVQVDYSTKSGSNAFHGDAAFWYNSSGFNANDWFQKQGEIFSGSPNQQPFAVNHQWAGSIGGPIVKDKLFFYVDQEGLYYALPSTQSVYLPLPGFSSAILSNIGATQPGELPYYTSLMNLYKGSPVYSQAIANPATFDPTGDNGCGGTAFTAPSLAAYGAGGLPCTGLAVASGVNHNKEWLLTTRIDYNISSADKIFGRFKADHGSQPTSTDLINPAVFSTKSIQPEYEGQINETHVFSPTMVNNFIVSGLWYSAIFLPDSGQDAVIGALGYSTLQVNGGALLSSLGGSSTPDYFFPQGRNSAMGQVTDDLSITRGAHTFKMGLNFRRDIFKDIDAQSNTGGYVQFGTLNDFANGLVIGANGGSLQQNFTTNPDVRIGFYSLGLYFQDEYRVTPNLKLTLALRGDRNSNAICSSDCFSRLQTQFTQMSHDPLTPYNQIILPDQHSAFPNIEKLALEPRFGFTWSPMGLKDTVLRGGIGVFSDLYQGVLLDSLIGNSPGTNFFDVAPAGNAVAPTLGTSVASLASGSNASFLSAFSSGGTLGSILASNPFFSPPGYFSVANQIQNPKYLEWSAEIQQAVGSKMSVNLKYVGTHGYDNLIQNGGVNATNATGLFGAFTPFGQTPAATLTSSGVVLSGLDPRFSTVRELSSVGISNYDGLVATVTRRMSYGFQGSLNYTYSHALDDSTTTNPGTPFNSFQSIVYQVNPYCLQCNNYSNADSDARHNITAQYVWNEPFKSQNRLLNYVVGGWALGGTFFYHTGLPYSAQNYQSGVFYDQSFPLGQFLGGSSNCSVGAGNYPYGGTCLLSSQFAAPNFTGGVTQPGFGNTPRNFFRGPGYFDTDMTVNKDFAVTEHAKFQLGASFFNILNHPNFALPDGYLFQGQFGNLYTMAIQPTSPYGSFQGAGVEGRLIQVHAKITF
jgi:hypothetical protein